MRFISTRAHGMLDYLVGVILIASPWIFNFARGGAETTIPVVLGIAAIIYSLITDYELSISKTLTMSTHLTLDLLSGVFLAVSPWLFGFNDVVYLPHLIFGLFEIGASLMTERKSVASRDHNSHHRTAH